MHQEVILINKQTLLKFLHRKLEATCSKYTSGDEQA